ncbi:MAG TPA: HEAT repeat domain-containing protein, partial [SAR202 cluster bacterium]|nr:HEAT repeat domain-containing protein [SAR202 cluster bacterium]
NVKDPAATDIILRYLADRSGEIALRNRIYAAWALGQIDDPRSIAVVRHRVYLDTPLTYSWSERRVHHEHPAEAGEIG